MNLQIEPLPSPEKHRPEPFSLSCEGFQQEEQVHTPRWLKNQTSKLKNRFEHVGVKLYVFFFLRFFPVCQPPFNTQTTSYAGHMSMNENIGYTQRF